MIHVDTEISKQYRVGYTTGVFDMFHIGHLNLLRNAKSLCDHLIVGVTTDELVSYKNTISIIPFTERIEIVKSIRYVDEVVAQDNMDKIVAYRKLHFDAIFVGDDWKGTDTWMSYEKEFQKLDVDIVYFPYTKSTSSTKLRLVLEKILNDE